MRTVLMLGVRWVLLATHKGELARHRERSVRPSSPAFCWSLFCLMACISLAQPNALSEGKAGKSRYRDWKSYGGGSDNIHYSALNQINRQNVHKLGVAWTFDTGDAFQGSEMQCNPIVANGVLFATTPKLRVIALQAATGKLLWSFNPDEGSEVKRLRRNRGVTYWEDRAYQRIYFVARQFLYSLDARTGRPVAAFGDSGRVDLREGLGRDPHGLSVSATSPGIVYQDLLIIGSLLSEDLPAPPGDIRAYDLRTGKLRWSFHTIPHPGEAGYQTWPKDAWRYAGGANNWCGMSLDEQRGLLFVPTGSAAFDFYGANRHGDKPLPFSRQSLTEDMLTRRTAEAHQAVLSRFRRVRSAGQFTPPSFEGTVIFPGFDGGGEWGGGAFDPETGLFYVNANEMPWILRLVPRPPRKDRTSSRELYLGNCASCHRDDLQGSPPEFPSLVGIGRKLSLNEIKTTIREGSGRMPGFKHLQADSIEAITRYVLSGQESDVKTRAEDPLPIYLKYRHDGYNKFLDPDGYPAVEPPWGTLTAIDLNRGEIVWKIPFGEFPELVKQGIRNTGSENYGGAVVTAGGLLFIGATNHDSKFHAFDKSTGKLLWETMLPAAGNATPAVFEVNRRQFIVIAAGGGKSNMPSGGTYVAFALPEDGVSDKRFRKETGSAKTLR